MDGGLCLLIQNEGHGFGQAFGLYLVHVVVVDDVVKVGVQVIQYIHHLMERSYFKTCLTQKAQTVAQSHRSYISILSLTQMRIHT